MTNITDAIYIIAIEFGCDLNDATVVVSKLIAAGLINVATTTATAKPLDLMPWFRWCDSEMPGAPAFERYARRGNHTEFRPREGYETDESKYPHWVEPTTPEGSK